MSLLLLAVCDTAAGRPPGRGPVFRPGPPAHAPAYGLRRKQVCGFELVFDAGVDLYVVVGRTDWYYHEGHFYRLRTGVWEISLRGDLWEPVVIDKLPSGLQIKAKAMAKLNGNGDSIAKLNGNRDPGGKGNSAVRPGAGDTKPNGNPGGSANDLAKANAGDHKLPGDPEGNGAKLHKPNADATTNKLDKPDTNANSDKLAKPSADANAGKPISKPADNNKTKPVGKGKKK